MSAHGPAIAGVVVILGGGAVVAGVVDTVAGMTDRPTISRWLADQARHPVRGPFVVGAYCALVAGFTWHMGQIIAESRP